MNKLMLILLCIVAWQTAAAREYPLSSADTNVCSAVVRSSTPAGFTDDLAVACAEAEKSGKKVLAVFSGSDWCSWCNELERCYLSQPEFVEEAKKSFELVFIDCPKDKSQLSDVARNINEKLIKKYNIIILPTIKILRADGSETLDAPLANGATPKQYIQMILRADAPEGRYEMLSREIGIVVSAIINKASERKFSSMFDLAGSIVEPLHRIGTNYMPRCVSLRAEVEKMQPDKSESALLAKINTTMLLLERCAGREIQGVVDLFIRELNKSHCAAECAGHGWSPMALSLVSACEFPGSEKDVYGIRLNMLSGRHRDVAGIDVGGLYNAVSNDMFGVQIGGLCNSVTYDVKGVQFSGLVNIGGLNSLWGIQVTGLFNTAGDVSGTQMSGFGNTCLRTAGFQVSGSDNIAGVVRGCQIAGGNNIALDMEGVQVAVDINSAYKLCGLQSSAIFNSCNILGGMQLSAINLSDDCNGFQLGVFNKGTEMAGLQLGVVNYANTLSGVQIGVCNIIKSSSVPVLPILNMDF